MKELFYCNPGFIDYKKAWDLQKKVFDLRCSHTIPDTLFLLEHPNTYTLGKTADKHNLVGSESYLKENSISVYDIDRGGDITYHGPGQIVGYPIISLEDWQKDTHKYLRALEQVIINCCAEFGLECGRNSKHTGVWLGDRKIAAIGIKVSRWITMHGFAFNVNTDLSLFNGIIPCGIQDKDVTSVQRETGKQAEIEMVKYILLDKFVEEFGYSAVKTVNVNEFENVQLEPVIQKGS